jgi:hypothetical protein
VAPPSDGSRFVLGETSGQALNERESNGCVARRERADDDKIRLSEEARGD